VVKLITLTLLKGIRIAATIGDIVPVTAKLSPTILYKREITKLI
jgi:hypothetical protein